MSGDDRAPEQEHHQCQSHDVAAWVAERGMIAGIKVDTGAKPLAGAEGETVTDASLKYVNRLSDFLFVAGRYANDKGARDVLWAPGQNR